MPFVPNDPDEEERRRQESLQLAGETGMSSAAPRTSAQNQGDPGYVDTAAYLQANKESAKDMANRVAGQLGEQAIKLRTDAGGLGTTFQNEIQSGRIDRNDDVINRAFDDPAAFVKNGGDVDSFRRMRDASYTGPTSFQDREDYAGIEKRIREAVDRAKGVDTEAGRSAMLQELGGNSTRGMVALDQLLIGADPEARGVLGEAAKPFAELTGYLDQVRGGAETAANAAKTGADTLRSDVRGRLDTAKNQFGTDLASRVESTRTSARTKAEELARKLRERQELSAEEAEVLGASPDAISSLNRFRGVLGADYGQNVDVDPYMSVRSPEEAIRAATLARPEDYARESALEMLAGEELPFLFAEDEKLAGTAPRSLLGFDASGSSGTAGNLLTSLDEQKLAGLGVDARRRFDNTFDNYDPGFLASLDAWMAGGGTFPTSGMFGMDKDQVIKTARAAARLGRLGIQADPWTF